MKHFLLVLAILMLGCGTDPQVVEEPASVIEETLSNVKDEPDRSPPHIQSSNVGPEEGPFDPVPLNQDGIFFEFDEDLGLFKADLSHDGKSLGWFPRVALTGDDIGTCIRLTPPAGGPFLEYDKEYHIDILFEDNTQLKKK